MTRSKNTVVAFNAGVVVGLCCLSLLQDTIGKEAYIAIIDEHWVSGWISVPISIAIMLFCLWRLSVSVYNECELARYKFLWESGVPDRLREAKWR